MALSEINHKSKSHFQVFCYLPWKIGDWADLEIVGRVRLSLRSRRMLRLMQTVLSLSQSIRSTVRPLQVCIIILMAPRSICLPPSVTCGSVIELYACVFIPVGCWTHPELLLCSPPQLLPLRSSFPYQCQAVRGGGSRRRPLCRSAQPCVCNHPGCRSADWCSYVGPCCRWLISHSVGYTSLPLINCPINPAAELIMHSLQAYTLQATQARVLILQPL